MTPPNRKEVGGLGAEEDQKRKLFCCLSEKMEDVFTSLRLQTDIKITNNKKLFLIKCLRVNYSVCISLHVSNFQDIRISRTDDVAACLTSPAQRAGSVAQLSAQAQHLGSVQSTRYQA